MNCRTCSAPIADGTRFCQVCGTPVSTPDTAAETSSAPTMIATAVSPAPDADTIMQAATTTAHTPIPEASASGPTIITAPSHDAEDLPSIDYAATPQPLPYPPYPPSSDDANTSAQAAPEADTANQLEAPAEPSSSFSPFNVVTDATIPAQPVRSASEWPPESLPLWAMHHVPTSPNQTQEDALHVTSNGTAPNAISAYGAPTPPAPARRISPVRILTIALVVVLVLGGGIFALIKVPGTPWNPNLPPAVATAMAAEDLYTQATKGAPILNDDLKAASSYHWDEGVVQPIFACGYQEGSYFAVANPTYLAPCYAEATNFTNFVFQTKITILQGTSAGLLFRGDSMAHNSYLFRISTDGSYLIYKSVFNAQTRELSYTKLSQGINKNIVVGTGHANLLTIIAQDDNISAYVNKHFIARINDKTYKHGQIGVYVEANTDEQVNGTFTNAQVWAL